MPRTGRRPGTSTTRAALLEAARRRFADAGYDAATLRAIAADAGVDPAVAVHFFGSKDGLFRAAVGWPFDPSGAVARMGGPGPGRLPERFARTFLGFWEEPATRASLLAVLRSAMTHETSAGLLREFVARHLFSQVAGLLDGPQVELRVDLAAAHLIGVAVLRYALRVEPVASASTEELVAWLTPALAFASNSPTKSDQFSSVTGRTAMSRTDGTVAYLAPRHRADKTAVCLLPTSEAGQAGPGSMLRTATIRLSAAPGRPANPDRSRRQTEPHKSAVPTT